MFTISIGKANATCPDKVTLTSGMVKAVQVVFNFSEEWDGFSKIAIFSNGATTLDVSLDDENKCYIPHEVLATAGKEVSVGIYGCKGEGDDYTAIPTVKCSLGKVLTGADPSGEEPAEPTPTVLDELIIRVENTYTSEEVDELLKSTMKTVKIRDLDILGDDVYLESNHVWQYSVTNPLIFEERKVTPPPFLAAHIFNVHRGASFRQYAIASNGLIYSRTFQNGEEMDDEQRGKPWERLINIENDNGIDSLRQAPKTEEWTPGNQKIIDFLNANKEKYSAYFDENGNVVIKEGAFGDWSTALSGYGHAGAQHSVVNNRRVIILPDAIGAHGEGNEILIAAVYGHGEGSYNLIGEKAEKAHIEGYGNVTYAPVSHVGGQYNTVEETAQCADVGGVNQNVSGVRAFVRGTGHIESGNTNTVLGWKNRVSGNYQTVIGKKNVDDPTKALIVGGGNENQADDVARRNIFTVGWNGDGNFYGDVTFTYGGKEYKVSDLLNRIAILEEKVKNL